MKAVAVIVARAATHAREPVAVPPVRGAVVQAMIAEKAETVGPAVVPDSPQTLRARARAELVRAVADVPDKVPPAVAVRVRARTGGPSAHPRSVAGARSRGPVGGAMIVRLAAEPDASPPLQLGGSVAASARAVRPPAPVAVALGQIPIPERAPGRVAIAARRAVTATPVVHEALAPGQTATVPARHPAAPTGGVPAVSDPRPGSPTVIVRAARSAVPAKAEVATAVRIRGAVTTVAVTTVDPRARGGAMMTVRAVGRRGPAATSAVRRVPVEVAMTVRIRGAVTTAVRRVPVEVAMTVPIRVAVTTVAVTTADPRAPGDAMTTARAADRPGPDRVRRVATAGMAVRRATQRGVAPVMGAHLVANAAPVIGPTLSPRSE